MSKTSTAFFTDHYELTMLDAALVSGTAHRWCVFEAFGRHLPLERRFGVVAGVGRVLDAVEAFRFGEAEIEALEERGFLRPATLEFLAGYRFSGDIDGYREGEAYFPGSPILTVVGPFAEAVLLETVVLSILNYDSAVATAAARITHAAGGRPIIEMGGRRTHEEAAVAAARAAYLVGFATTSNLEAGRRYGIPTAGTAAHAFTQVHDDEPSAFAAQVAALGPGTTLLVDTYDLGNGIRNAVAAAGPGLGAVRIDSGDLVERAWQARAMLDDLGAVGTQVVLTGDLDADSVAALAGAPVDAIGVGTSVVTGDGAPTCGFVYKLVARTDGADRHGPWLPVVKQSPGKATIGGRKRAWRLFGPDGRAEVECLSVTDGAPVGLARALQVPMVRGGEVVHRPSLADIRAHHRLALTELSDVAFSRRPGPPAVEVRPPTPAEMETL